ncbi:MAG: response regulator transcription factor [Cyclobacteriaceae bacterium]
MARILIVEDEPNMRLGLKDNLEFENFEVALAEDGESGLRMMEGQNFDLVLLDIMMPKLSGIDMCKAVRKKGIEVPIIFLTAKGEELDTVLGLEIGADDYITKPFSLRELLARVKAVLRRSTDKPENISTDTQIGNLTVNFKQYEAYIDALPEKMSHKEFAILEFFVANKNQIVSRSQLLQEVWGYDSQPTTRTVDNFVLRLRQRIELNPNDPKIILTVHGVGYKMVAN